MGYLALLHRRSVRPTVACGSEHFSDCSRFGTADSVRFKAQQGSGHNAYRHFQFRVAGNNIVLRVYLVECLPMRKRGTCLAVIDMFWIVGYISALGISWSMMPSVIRMLGKQFRPSSWRVLAIVCGTPSLVIACTSGLLPPSPRHSLHRRRLGQALTVLEQMYAINNSKHADTYPVRDLEGLVRPDDEDEAGIIQRYFTKTWERIHRVYKPPYKRVTLCGMLACLLHFPGFAWLALWNTHVLQEMAEDHVNVVGGNGTCRVDVQSMALDFLRSCDEVNEARFEMLSLISLGYVLGETLLVLGIDVIGRRSCLILSGLAGSLASLTLIFRLHHTIRVTLSSIFLAAYAIGRTTTCVSLLENYPTALRGTMMGLTRILPHLTAFALQLSLRTTCLLSIIVASASLMGAAIAMLLVPDLTRLPMKE
ncbi:PREDICTED: synaptic vesicle 2-related protein-like isoform X2 [Wasmannia auropunctata]|uniref:synaptic vesicle 2-related protein-like isoform X2 n=1 Tax=Wasmannia auropunctata TaxID=64793 RepID=UPI0005F06215|nr:PREDICTED: synaptic vesicle 2-related protein-like isoform X2 [Wasmannia auropunctata]XP_011694280.1 PREDICTED: synaptic vesicle 2-related protein-like isoform X2 [Wasmannia auropunctata]